MLNSQKEIIIMIKKKTTAFLGIPGKRTDFVSEIRMLGFATRGRRRARPPKRGGPLVTVSPPTSPPYFDLATANNPGKVRDMLALAQREKNARQTASKPACTRKRSPGLQKEKKKERMLVS